MSRRRLLLDPSWRLSAVTAFGAAVLAAACASSGHVIAAIGFVGASLTVVTAMVVSAALMGLPPEAGPAPDEDDGGGGGRGPDPDPDAPDDPAGGGVDWERFERDFRAYADRSPTHA